MRPTGLSWTPRPIAAPLAQRVVAVGMLAMLTAVCAIALLLWNLRRDALAQSRASTANLAMMLSGQTARAVETVDLVLQDIQAHLQAQGAESAEQVGALLASAPVHERLTREGERLKLVQSLGLVDARGLLVNTAGVLLAEPVDLSDRVYFRRLQTEDEPGLFISAPVRNRVDGSWTIFLARRLHDSAGRFAGLVLGGLPVTYLAQVLQSLVLPPDSSITLLRRDGVVLMRNLDPLGSIGQAIRPESAWFAAVAAGGGTVDGSGRFDGTDRMIAVQPVPGLPLVVNVGIARAEILRHWRADAVQVVAGTLLILAGCAVLLRLLTRIVARLDNSRASLAFRNAELTRTSEQLALSQARVEAQTQVLHTTLETMDQGLMMVDAEQRIVLCNHQAMEMLDLPAELMSSRPAFSEVMAYQYGRNEFASADPAVRSLISSRPLLDTPHYERRRPNGLVIEVRTTRLAGGGVVRTFTDITARRAAEDRIRHFAHHDALTGLCNRVMFGEQLQAALLAAQRGQHSLAVLYLDLDHFKLVNDQLGHAAGDLLLADVARRMRASVRDGDTVARMGGDEFAIIQPNADRPASTMALARRLLERIASPYELQGEAAVIGVSIGVAWYPEDGLEAEDLLRHADAALYAAKRGGRNAVCCYRPVLAEEE